MIQRALTPVRSRKGKSLLAHTSVPLELPGFWSGLHRNRARRDRPGNLRPLGRLAVGVAMMGAVLAWISGNPLAMAAAKWVTIGLAILPFLLSLRRSGERAGRLAERLENQGGNK